VFQALFSRALFIARWLSLALAPLFGWLAVAFWRRWLSLFGVAFWRFLGVFLSSAFWRRFLNE
jgi:hypothetical protein